MRRLFLYFVRGGDLPVSVWDTRYPEHVAVHPSGNGGLVQSKKISNDQELTQSDPTSCPQNQKGNN